MMNAEVQTVKQPVVTPKRKKIRIRWAGILFLAPAITAFVLFKYLPLLQAAYMSFFDYKIMNPPGQWIGFSNYKQLINSSYFWNAFSNTFIFYLMFLALTFWVPIVQAILLNEIKRANIVFRFLYLVPTAIPAVAGYILWKWMYNPDYGLFNSVLEKLGLGPLGWLNDPAMSKLSIVLPATLGGGIAMLIYYSALQGISKEVLEAARIDGATPVQRLVKIVMPGLAFIIGIQFINFSASIFLTFDPMYIMTGGGPVDSTKVLSMLVYDSAFVEYRFGMAGAISMFMFVIIAVITFFQLKISRQGAN